MYHWTPRISWVEKRINTIYYSEEKKERKKKTNTCLLLRKEYDKTITTTVECRMGVSDVQLKSNSKTELTRTTIYDPHPRPQLSKFHLYFIYCKWTCMVYWLKNKNKSTVDGLNVVHNFRYAYIKEKKTRYSNIEKFGCIHNWGLDKFTCKWKYLDTDKIKYKYLHFHISVLI